jgi:hypothetical protein
LLIDAVSLGAATLGEPLMAPVAVSIRAHDQKPLAVIVTVLARSSGPDRVDADGGADGEGAEADGGPAEGGAEATPGGSEPHADSPATRVARITTVPQRTPAGYPPGTMGW